MKKAMTMNSQLHMKHRFAAGRLHLLTGSKRFGVQGLSRIRLGRMHGLSTSLISHHVPSPPSLDSLPSPPDPISLGDDLS
jgi:hypothetical protein